MYCWSCGHRLARTDAPCERCGASAPRLPPEVQGEHGIRVCTGCGYRGEGIGYFRRAGHAALLVGATVLTYGIGGLVYWLVKRHESVCPSCGLSWKRSRPMGGELGPVGSGKREGLPARRTESPSRPTPASPSLPSAGVTRRVVGVLLALMSVFFLGLGISEGEAVLAVMSLVFGLSGAASFAWGWSSRQRRREAILREMQGRVLHLARARGGTLTATDVASELDLSLNGAERVLLSLDDGFRVRSDVTDEGLLIFEFPEIRWSGSALEPGPAPEAGPGPRDGVEEGGSGERASAPESEPETPTGPGRSRPG
jgi:hypothetical protein